MEIGYEADRNEKVYCCGVVMLPEVQKLHFKSYFHSCNLLSSNPPAAANTELYAAGRFSAARIMASHDDDSWWKLGTFFTI